MIIDVKKTLFELGYKYFYFCCNRHFNMAVGEQLLIFLEAALVVIQGTATFLSSTLNFTLVLTSWGLILCDSEILIMLHDAKTIWVSRLSSFYTRTRQSTQRTACESEKL